MTTQYIFFSGKGGVGKTSMACTYAVRLAEEGKKTLIVTTDPASNLADVFEQLIGHQVTPIQGLPNLWAMEIDSDKATQEYIDRAMEPIRAAFPPQIVQVMEEQMSGPCTAEVAAFDRFTDFLEVPAGDETVFDVVIFDTAPTGHTIRLLELPAEWSQSIDAASAGSGQTCLGPAAAIQDAKHKYERALAAMRESDQTTFIFVLHPEAISIKETRRAIGELSKLEIHNFQVIVNSIIPPEAAQNSLFAARAVMQTRYLKQIETDLPYPTQRMTLLSGEIKGVKRLSQVAKIFFDGDSAAKTFVAESVQPQLAALATPLEDVRASPAAKRSPPDGILCREGRRGQDGRFVHHCRMAGSPGTQNIVVDHRSGRPSGRRIGQPGGRRNRAGTRPAQSLGGQDRPESRGRNLQRTDSRRCPPARSSGECHRNHGRGTELTLHRRDGRFRQVHRVRFTRPMACSGF